MTGQSSRPRTDASPPAASIFGVAALRRDGAVLSVSEAEALVAARWGVEGIAHPLAAEVDQNLRIAAAGRSWLLKVVPVDEEEAVTDLVTAALLHLEEVSDVVVPRVLRAATGEPFVRFVDSDGAKRRAWMSTFLDGRLLRTTRADEATRRRIGRALAGLAVALRDFDHDRADRALSWDLRHADKMLAMQAELPSGARREALTECLERFAATVVPRLEPLPRQVVHNDLSQDNTVLADDCSIGVIDFGDIVRTQRVNDLAIAMADHVEGEAELLAPALGVAAGYVEVLPLEDAELAILPDLVRTRIATRIIGGEWRAARFPENRAYLARNVERLWGVFASMPADAPPSYAERIASLRRGDVR